MKHGRDRTPAEPLRPSEFAAMLEVEYATLWCVAAAVLGRRSGADDVIQDASVVALGKIGEFRRGSSFRAWMAEIVRNVARNHRRKEARRRGDGDVTLQAAGAGAGPGDEAFDRRVADSLAELSEDARTCLLLRVVRSMSYREIALSLGMPEGTVMSHVHRARRAIRARLSEGTGPEGTPRRDD